MFYSPSPGTPFYRELEQSGQLKSESEFPWPDWHGQLGFSWRHPNFANGEETSYILQAFQRDFEVNGPSVLRTYARFCRADRGTNSTQTGEYVDGSHESLVDWASKVWLRQPPHEGVLPRSPGAVCQDVSAA